MHDPAFFFKKIKIGGSPTKKTETVAITIFFTLKKYFAPRIKLPL